MVVTMFRNPCKIAINNMVDISPISKNDKIHNIYNMCLTLFNSKSRSYLSDDLMKMAMVICINDAWSAVLLTI
jgi:hypothetical protein